MAGVTSRHYSVDGVLLQGSFDFERFSRCSAISQNGELNYFFRNAQLIYLCSHKLSLFPLTYLTFSPTFASTFITTNPKMADNNYCFCVFTMSSPDSEFFECEDNVNAEVEAQLMGIAVKADDKL